MCTCITRWRGATNMHCDSPNSSSCYRTCITAPLASDARLASDLIEGRGQGSGGRTYTSTPLGAHRRRRTTPVVPLLTTVTQPGMPPTAMSASGMLPPEKLRLAFTVASRTTWRPPRLDTLPDPNRISSGSRSSLGSCSSISSSSSSGSACACTVASAPSQPFLFPAPVGTSTRKRKAARHVEELTECSGVPQQAPESPRSARNDSASRKAACKVSCDSRPRIP